MSIDGKWVSDLGSKMEIEVDDDGLMTGIYTTVIGDTQGNYPLVGYVNFAPDGQSIATIGWVVLWINEKGNDQSVTTWTGQVQLTEPENGAQVMVTTWLYVKETQPSENWSSTLMGFNTFKRDHSDSA